jgi:hypothetical protein
MPEVEITRRRGRVRPDHRDRGRNEQKDAAGRLDVQESLEGLTRDLRDAHERLPRLGRGILGAALLWMSGVWHT